MLVVGAVLAEVGAGVRAGAVMVGVVASDLEASLG